MDHADHSAPPMHFGLLLKMRREQWDLKQREVLVHLPGWTQANYSRLESGVIAPAFEHLLPLYTALGLAGVQWTVADRQAFLELARRRIEAKKTHWERRSEAEWAELRYALANADLLPDEAAISPQKGTPPRPLLAETRHLVGREEWIATVLAAIENPPAKKLLVLQGPMGVGKSSELHRLARHFLHADHPAYQVLWLPLLPIERASSPDASLEAFLGSLLAEGGDPLPSSSLSSVEARTAYVLAHLEHSARPSVILVDNAEGILTDEGMLAPCWEHFLERFLLSQHQATMLLATKEWPGWAGRERVFVAETTVPLLSVQTGVLLLQHLGLERVPVQHLRAVCERVGGIPLCLEWVAALAQDPLLLDDWRSFESGEEMHEDRTQQEGTTQRLLQLLAEPALLRGHFASKLQPLLERIIEKRLSPEAGRVLTLLAVSNIPLGKPALQVLCDRPRPLKELRDASLLVAYPSRVQLLPMVASAVQQRLTAQDVKEQEEQLVQALFCWLDEGMMSDRERGEVITELAVLLLIHRRLLDAAQLLLRYGWLSFNLGYAPRLARLAQEGMHYSDGHGTEDDAYGSVLLDYLLSPFLGQAIDSRKRASEYQHIRAAALTGRVVLLPPTEVYLTHYLMVHALNEVRFEDAQTLLDECSDRLEPLLPANPDLQASLLEKRAMLVGTWSEYLEEQGAIQAARTLQEQTIALYRQGVLLLTKHEAPSPLQQSRMKKRLALFLTNLGYELNRIGRHEEALQAIERSITLKEQGSVEVGALAASYGEKSQILAQLGRFQEALLFDQQALAEVQRLADAGHTLSQEEVWVYRINRGGLYLRLGRVDEAERLLRDALPHVHPRRRIYRMHAEEALAEMAQWRQSAASSQHQVDWRWVERYRQLDAYDAYWWWAQAGPFTAEEQRRWDELYTPDPDETVKEQLGRLMTQARERELAAALAEQREPRLHYPALDVEEVRCRIAGMLQLDVEISREEPNAIVRRLYHGAIEEEATFLRMIEATSEGDTERYRALNQSLGFVPTCEELEEALSHVTDALRQGMKHPETVEVCQRLIQFLQERLQLSPDLSSQEAETPGVPQENAAHSSPPRMVSAQTARRFFEAVLRESGSPEWQVLIDPKASGPRVEGAAHQLFLEDRSVSLDKIRRYVADELAGHIARGVAGERSPLGLLGIGTKGFLTTEEGITSYQESQVAALQGQALDDWGNWLGALATGLAGGVMTPPQTFLPLYTFFESLFLLRRRLRRSDEDVQTAQQRAREVALSRCLRTFRGVPNLERAGVFFGKDVVYLRGLRLIEHAVAQDETVLDHLAVGKVALEHLPDLQELGIVPSPQLFRKLAYDPDLEAYVLSFEQMEEQTTQRE